MVVQRDRVEEIVARVGADLGGNCAFRTMYHDHANEAQIGAHCVFANVERDDGLLLEQGNDLHHPLLRVHNFVRGVFQRLDRYNGGRHFVFVLGIGDVYASARDSGSTVHFIGVGVEIAMDDVVLQIHADLAGIVGQQKHAGQSVVRYH